MYSDLSRYFLALILNIYREENDAMSMDVDVAHRVVDCVGNMEDIQYVRLMDVPSVLNHVVSVGHMVGVLSARH